MSELEKIAKDATQMWISKLRELEKDIDAGRVRSKDLPMRLNRIGLEVEARREFVEAVARREALGQRAL